VKKVHANMAQFQEDEEILAVLEKEIDLKNWGF
jgi:hypothetical protein